MLIGPSLAILRRWWWVALAGFVALGSVVGFLIHTNPPNYRATNEVTFVDYEGNAFDSANAYINTSIHLDVFERTIAAAVTDLGHPPTGSPGARFRVSVAADGTPSLVVTCDSRLQRAAVETCRDVGRRMMTTAQDLQRSIGVPPRARIMGIETTPVRLAEFTKNRSRLILAIAGAGSALILAAVFGLDGLYRRQGGVGQDGGRRGPLRPAAAIGGLALASALVMTVAVTATERAPTDYRATQMVILMPPTLPPRPDRPVSQQGTQNPFLSYTTGFDVLSQVLALHAGSSAVRHSLSGPGNSASYGVVNWLAGPTPVSTSGAPTPLITVSARSHDPRLARTTAGAVIADLAREVTDVQSRAGAPRPTWVTLRPVTVLDVVALRPSRKRAVLSLTALGVAGLIACRALIIRLRRPVPARPALRQGGGPAPIPTGPGTWR